ncbi:anthranilate synthase component I family protein [Candidatus Woesearchaeota archaeon]|nr:anthranilate synthase component I family protein [Candidatus Woesearchaeota archaeon]
MRYEIVSRPFEYGCAFEHYKDISRRNQSLLMESKTKNLAYGKQSIVATNLALKISGKDGYFRIEALNEQGIGLMKDLSQDDFPYAEFLMNKGYVMDGKIRYEDRHNMTEEQRVHAISQASVVRTFMDKYRCDSKHLGLYGAFAYDFVRQFEDIGHKHAGEEGDDYTLFLPTDVFVFDEIRNSAMHHSIDVPGKKDQFAYARPEPSFDLVSRDNFRKDDFIRSIQTIKDDIMNGRFMQCVISRSMDIATKTDPIDTYGYLRRANPSPYLFYFDLGPDGTLYGSSPEYHVVVEDRKVKIRPLAGTRRLTGQALKDANLRAELMTDKKELAEHSMLVDLALSEICRLSNPDTVRLTDTRTLEFYPNLMHLASGIEGILREDFDAIDALLTTIPAGTLSGAPKREAMKAIEELEPHRRGYYGGAAGYLAFNGDMNTAIIIRSIHEIGGRSRVQAGAGVVKDSIPEKEYEETQLKMSKMSESLEVI